MYTDEADFRGLKIPKFLAKSAKKGKNYSSFLSFNLCVLCEKPFVSMEESIWLLFPFLTFRMFSWRR